MGKKRRKKGAKPPKKAPVNLDLSNRKIERFVNAVGKAASKNPKLRGKLPKAVMLSIAMDDGHVHHMFPDDSNIQKAILNSCVRSSPVGNEAALLLPSKHQPSSIKSKEREALPDVPSSAAGRKIIFKHGRAPGDILMLSAGIRDFKRLFPEIEVNVETKFNTLFDNNPYINRDLKKDDDGVEWYAVGYPTIHCSNNGYIHFAQAFLLDMISIVDAHNPLPLSIGEFCSTFANGGADNYGNIEKFPNEAKEPFISWKKKYKGFCKDSFRQWGDLHLSREERATNMIKEVYGVDTYWVIAPGGKRDCTCKIWDWRRFQKVIDYFEGLIKFVVIGKGDHLIEPLKGVIDLVDKTPDVRELVPLIYHSDGCVSGVSYIHHLAAAMPPKPISRGVGKGFWDSSRKPCVSIYGGREPTSFTWYCNHQILHTNGAFSCCDSGGCWHSRIVPLNKDPDKNKRLCVHTVKSEGKTIQSCMDLITAQDVIRAIEIYYEGNIYTYEKPKTSAPVDLLKPIVGKTDDRLLFKKFDLTPETPVTEYVSSDKKEINLLASLKSRGGGEQSACKIKEILETDGWKVNLYPWSSVHENYKNVEVMSHSMTNGMGSHMKPGLPLLFYANDQIGDFCREELTGAVVKKSSAIIIGINYVNGKLPKSRWLSASKKVRAVIFQNNEKREEFDRDAVGYLDTKRVVLFGAIDLQQFSETLIPERSEDEPLIIIKHCMADYRKYVTKKSVGSGEKRHVYQRNIIKETDVQFYGRLVKDLKFPIEFRFMKAHQELSDYYKDDSRFVFYDYDEVPVSQFLAEGHVYLYRTSNMWRDQYPRVVAEALAVGLPCLVEPRDGNKDRVEHGDTGFYCVDYDAFKYALKLLRRKERLRFQMGEAAREWAMKKLNPARWGDVVNEILRVE